MTANERFILDFLFYAEIADISREPGQTAIEVPRMLILRARRLAKRIKARKQGGK